MLLWFETNAFEAAVARPRAFGAVIIREPFASPNARHVECWMRDPDGYVVVLASREATSADRSLLPPATLARESDRRLIDDAATSAGGATSPRRDR